MKKLKKLIKQVKSLSKAKRLQILSLVLLGTISITLGYSYALFKREIVGGNVDLRVGALSYNIESSSLNDAYQATVEAGGETVIEITVTSLAPIASKYQMVYRSENDLTDIVVGYSSATVDPPNGEMDANGTKKVTAVIQNNSGSPVTVTFGVKGGLVHNSIEDIILEENEYKLETVVYVKTVDITIASVKVDGKEATSIPTSGTYTLSNYACEKGSTLEWDTYKKRIGFSTGTKAGESCSLEFTKSTDYPLLTSIAKQGDYVAYVGNNGCQLNGTAVTGYGEAESSNSCLGYNANDTEDTNGNTYGYCQYAKFYVKGWRIAYTEDNRAYLISAGSPECNARTSDTESATYISEANEKAKKYCNRNYVDGDCSDNSDSWAIGDTDFNKITAQMTNTTGGYLYTSISGATKCGSVHSKEVCGYNNDLIDNGGFYWFAATHDVYSTYGVCWYERYVADMGISSNTTVAFGLRPIIRLSSSVYVTGGSGTMNDPYTIGYVPQHNGGTERPN